jgi:hypothetical protein
MSRSAHRAKSEMIEAGKRTGEQRAARCGVLSFR